MRKASSASFDPSSVYSEDWLSGATESVTSRVRRQCLEKRATIKRGDVHEVDMLIARRGSEGSESCRFLVRWQGADKREECVIGQRRYSHSLFCLL